MTVFKGTSNEPTAWYKQRKIWVRFNHLFLRRINANATSDTSCSIREDTACCWCVSLLSICVHIMHIIRRSASHESFIINHILYIFYMFNHCPSQLFTYIHCTCTCIYILLFWWKLDPTVISSSMKTAFVVLTRIYHVCISRHKLP